MSAELRDTVCALSERNSELAKRLIVLVEGMDRTARENELAKKTAPAA